MHAVLVYLLHFHSQAQMIPTCCLHAESQKQQHWHCHGLMFWVRLRMGRCRTQCLMSSSHNKTCLCCKQEEMRHIQRFMGYCLALRERRPAGQQAVFSSLGIGGPPLLPLLLLSPLSPLLLLLSPLFHAAVPVPTGRLCVLEAATAHDFSASCMRQITLACHKHA